MSSAIRPFDALEQTIRQRAEQLAAGEGGDTSYTCRLLAGTLEKIGGKVREEADELIEAAAEPGDEGRSHFIYEAGDVVYHLLVLLRKQGVDFAEVEAELARRFGMSGLDEKAARTSK